MGCASSKSELDPGAWSGQERAAEERRPERVAELEVELAQLQSKYRESQQELARVTAALESAETELAIWKPHVVDEPQDSIAAQHVRSFRIGDRVQHGTSSVGAASYGSRWLGTITAHVNEDGITKHQVLFDNGEEHTYQPHSMHKLKHVQEEEIKKRVAFNTTPLPPAASVPPLTLRPRPDSPTACSDGQLSPRGSDGKPRGRRRKSRQTASDVGRRLSPAPDESLAGGGASAAAATAAASTTAAAAAADAVASSLASAANAASAIRLPSFGSADKPSTDDELFLTRSVSLPLPSRNGQKPRSSLEFLKTRLESQVPE